MNYFQRILQLAQPEGEEASSLRSWLIIVNSLLVGISLLFIFFWLYAGQKNQIVPPFWTTLVVPIVYGLGVVLAWQWRLWQSALLLVFWFILVATRTFWVMPAYGELIVSLYVINLIFASIFLSKRVVTLFAVISLFLYTVLTFKKFNYSFSIAGTQLDFVAQYLVGLTVLALVYLLILLSLKINRLKTLAAQESEARYRLLFEASPIALWEQDGSAIKTRIDRLRAEGIQDFRTHFKQNPLLMFEMMGLTKITDVNETAVSMYKAKDKAELMDNLDRFVPEESYSFILDSLAAMANQESYFEREISSLTLDGEKLTVLYRWVVPPEKADSYSTVIVSIVDVTSRKVVEDALQNYSERFRGLHELDLAINVKKSPEEISAVALEFVAQFIPSSGAEIWGFDETGQIVSLLAMVFSTDDAERPFYDGPQPAAFLLSEEIQDDMRNNQPYMVDDLSTLRYLPPALANLEKCGMRSFLQLPLLVRGKPIGFLNIYDQDSDTFTPEYLGMAREFAAPLAIALGNVQLYVAENSARNQAEILRRVAADLNSSLDLEPLLKQILEYLEQVVPYDSATIFLEKDGALNVVARRGLSGNVDQEHIDLRNEELAVHQVFALGKPRLVVDTKTEPNWTPYPGFEYIRCWLAIPLQVKGKPIGALTLDNAVARFYTEKNQEIALAFANQAAVAIENARLYQRSLRYAEDLEVRVNERTRDLSTLYEITAVASTHPELDKILDRSLEIVLRTLGCTSGAIFIKEADGRFELKSHRGVPENILPIVSVFEYEDGFIKQVVDNPNPVFIRDLAASPVLKPLNLPSGTFSYAGVSIRVKNNVVGILNTVHRDGEQFSPEDFALLTSVADQLGVVIENGRLHQQNQEVAVLQERERLARELHDSVTQSLYSLMLFAEASKELSKMGNGEKLAEYLDDIVTTAQQALKEMRLMLFELRAGALGEAGLAKAIRYRLEAVEGRSGMEANLKVDLEIDIPQKLRRTLYLIAQEALNNTLKHAKATKVFVTLGMQGNKLLMTIEDNGRGFSKNTSKMGGMGLKTMQERIEAVGGNLTINSLLDVGTKIEISVDLAKYGVV